MKNFGKILLRKFSSKKPAKGSKMLSGSFGDLMKTDFPTTKPSTKPPASSLKDTNEWQYDTKRSLFIKYIWQPDGSFKKGFKSLPWMKNPWTIS